MAPRATQPKAKAPNPKSYAQKTIVKQDRKAAVTSNASRPTPAGDAMRFAAAEQALAPSEARRIVANPSHNFYGHSWRGCVALDVMSTSDDSDISIAVTDDPANTVLITGTGFEAHLENDDDPSFKRSMGLASQKRVTYMRKPRLAKFKSLLPGLRPAGQVLSTVASGAFSGESVSRSTVSFESFGVIGTTSPEYDTSNIGTASSIRTGAGAYSFSQTSTGGMFLFDSAGKVVDYKQKDNANAGRYLIKSAGQPVPDNYKLAITANTTCQSTVVISGSVHDLGVTSQLALYDGNDIFKHVSTSPVVYNVQNGTFTTANCDTTSFSASDEIWAVLNLSWRYYPPGHASSTLFEGKAYAVNYAVEITGNASVPIAPPVASEYQVFSETDYAPMVYMSDGWRAESRDVLCTYMGNALDNAGTIVSNTLPGDIYWNSPVDYDVEGLTRTPEARSARLSSCDGQGGFLQPLVNATSFPFIDSTSSVFEDEDARKKPVGVIAVRGMQSGQRFRLLIRQIYTIETMALPLCPVKTVADPVVRDIIAAVTAVRRRSTDNFGHLAFVMAAKATLTLLIQNRMLILDAAKFAWEFTQKAYQLANRHAAIPPPPGGRNQLAIAN